MSKQNKKIVKMIDVGAKKVTKRIAEELSLDPNEPYINLVLIAENSSFIAKKAKTLGTNARGLKNIIDKVLLPYQFDANEMRNKGVETIKITGPVVTDGADPILLFKKPNGTISKKQSV